MIAQLSDLSFRRHIAVQALIVLDFLLSLSAKAKEKQAAITPQNKSVMYQDQLLSDEDVRILLCLKYTASDIVDPLGIRHKESDRRLPQEGR